MNQKPEITYDDFQKLDMRIGHIRFVEPVEGADKLLRCEVDFGPLEETSPEASSDAAGDKDDDSTPDDHSDEHEFPLGKAEYADRHVRQIVSGIREFFPDYEELVGKRVLYVINLAPRTIRGVESQGMLMAVDGKDGQPVFLTADHEVDAGASVR